MPKALPKSPILAKLPLACSDESAAVAFMEEQRGWLTEPSCQKCGVVGECYPMKSVKKDGTPRYLWRCRACEGQYTVKTGTIMEDSPIPVHKWCHAFWLACSSKKGVSAKQIERTLMVTYKTALFMMHRVRWAMKPANDQQAKLGGNGETVEFDEVYIGGRPRRVSLRRDGSVRKAPRYDFSKRKTPVLAGVERGGNVKARVVADVKKQTLPKHVMEMVDTKAHLMTDERVSYRVIGRDFASHAAVNHSDGEYVRGDVTTNSIEGFFAGVQRKVKGTHHVISKKHLQRYMDEAVFLYNNRKVDDGERTVRAIRAGVGRRLTYAEQVAS